nr:aryl-sulfate sulfotransferase [uncultured Anaerosporobacter sp.]
MKKKYYFLIGIIVLLLIVGILLVTNDSLKDKIYLNYYTSIKTGESIGEQIHVVDNKKDVSMWNTDLQNTIEKKIAKEAKKATFDDPFIIYNPYGTNTCAVNVYYTTKEATSMEYTISVDEEGIPEFTRTAYNGQETGTTKTHEYQIIGLIPNEVNTVTMRSKNSEGEVVDEYTFTITMKGLVTDSQSKLEITEGDSNQEISEGLYAVLGHDKAYNANVYIYDNDGIIRSELPLRGYRSDRILFIDDTMVYSYDFNKLVFVNRLGKIVRKINLGNYELHHDFEYDEINNTILLLANELGTDTIEDVIIRVDLEDGAVTKLVDMKDLMPEAKVMAVEPEEGNTYGGDELDWIHLNTLDIIDGKDLILSSREYSTIIRLNNIYEQPEIAYFISDETVWNGTVYEDYMLDKVGDFVSQAGQHTVTYFEDPSLPDNQYYLYMFNNNYKGARTRPDFDWSAYVGAGTYSKGDNSYLYQYLVDEENGTYELVKKVALPYSSIVSSTQYYKENLVTSSGMSHCFNEYDSEGKLIREYKYSAEKYAYRVLKYSFDSFWFE